MHFKSTVQGRGELLRWVPHPYQVIPIPLLVVEDFPKTYFTYLLNAGTTTDLHCGVFVISGVANHNVLIDTGPSRTGFESKQFSCRDEVPFAAALTGC